MGATRAGRCCWATINPLIGNGFPFSQEGAIRASLDNLGRIVDNGWSVLIYPEGKKTHGGPIQPFMSGTGLLAVGGNLSVVPLRLHIHKMGIPGAFPLLRRGDIEICFGKPLTFSPETTHLEATAAIEEAVRAGVPDRGAQRTPPMPRGRSRRRELSAVEGLGGWRHRWWYWTRALMKIAVPARSTPITPTASWCTTPPTSAATTKNTAPA